MHRPVALLLLALAPLIAPAASPADVHLPDRAISPPSRAHGSTVARVVTRTRVRPRLRSRRGTWTLRAQTAWSRQAHVLLALDLRRRGGIAWVKVLLPTRPTGRTGWVRRDDLALSRTDMWIDVRTRSRVVTVYRSGRRVRRFRAVVGSPATPTPHTLAAVYERNRQPDRRGFLGPWVLSLTAFSRVLEDYGGGPGRVALHGRGGASLRDPLGSARSHGCVRVRNRDIAWLARHVPRGTPVRLRR